MAYIMDTNEEERAKVCCPTFPLVVIFTTSRLVILNFWVSANQGITVEVGRASFETEQRRFTILDAPVVFLIYCICWLYAFYRPKTLFLSELISKLWFLILWRCWTYFVTNLRGIKTMCQTWSVGHPRQISVSWYVNMSNSYCIIF